MGTTRFKGENASERLSFSEISDSDMIQLRHKPGTEEDSDKGISKASLCSCPFGVSDTSASTAVKSAVLTDSNPDFNLVSGREVVVCFTMLVPGDFDHSVTGEKSQKVTRENDQKSHLTPLIIRFPEDCQKQFLPF
ncbi:MAG: hypothetical protein SOZ96_12920, partial [Treponema sp.]|nr:hypothetical protein [Treponema sp.]